MSSVPTMQTTFSHSISRVIQRQLAVLWVRRYLLAIPILLSLPIGLMLSYFMPRTYVSSSLLLLQESGGVLGSREVVPPYQSQDRFNGLQALLKSERVLAAVVREMRRDQPPLSAREMPLALDALKRALSIEMLSSEVIQVQLKGRQGPGLGKNLETILARLLESLLSPEDVIVTAPRMVVERRKEQLGQAERKYSESLQRAKERTSGTQRTPSSADSERMAALLDNQKQAQTTIRALRRELGLKDSEPTKIDASINAARARLAELGTSNDGGRMDVKIAQRQLTQLIELQNLEEVQAQRKIEIDRVAADLAEAKKLASATLDIVERDVAEAKAEVEAARYRFTEAERRFGTRLGNSNFQILKSPEQITIIDPPKDPEFPLYGRSIILILSILAGSLIGLGLALGADFADARLRSEEALGRITGAPLWGRLPPTA